MTLIEESEDSYFHVYSSISDHLLYDVFILGAWFLELFCKCVWWLNDNVVFVRYTYVTVGIMHGAICKSSDAKKQKLLPNLALWQWINLFKNYVIYS